MNYSLPQFSGDMPDGYSFTESLFTPEQKPHKLTVITNSLRNTYLDCSMKYYWEYIRRLSPKVTPDYFVWGSMLHYAMEQSVNGLGIDEIQDRLRKIVEAEAKQRPISDKLITLYEGLILLIPYVLDGYLLHYKNEYDRYEVIVPERKFVVPLGNENTRDNEGAGWTFEGKIDKVVLDTRTGSHYIWDIKTPASTGPSFFDRLPLDSQMKGYLLGTQRGIGYGDVNHAVYDVIQKPSQQQKLACEDPETWAETIGRYYLTKHEDLYKRQVIPYAQKAIDDYYVELCMLAKRIAYDQMEGLWIKHHPGNRIGYCPFFDICINGEDPIHMAAFYERPLEAYNNELKEEA